VKQRIGDALKDLGIYVLWVALSALAALTAYQAYGTLLYVGLLIVDSPNLRPPGWNTATIHGLSRFLVLVLGMCWLLAVSLMINYLREGVVQRRLWRRVLWSVLSLGAVYCASYLALVILQ
jgi:hypothetical protein